MQIHQIRNATLVITYHNVKFLIDPWLMPKDYMEGFDVGVNADVRQPRVDLPINVEQIVNVDAVILTHYHPDHWDAFAAQALDKDIVFFVQYQYGIINLVILFFTVSQYSVMHLPVPAEVDRGSGDFRCMSPDVDREENKGKNALFGGIDKLRFKKQVVPGDVLKLEVKIIKQKGPIGV